MDGRRKSAVIQALIAILDDKNEPPTSASLLARIIMKEVIIPLIEETIDSTILSWTEDGRTKQAKTH